jgi:hypothetical protein
MAKVDTLNKLIDTHEERILGVLKKLEDDIVAELQQLAGGELKLSTQLAIQFRPSLKKLIEDNYLKEADILVREYDEIIKEYQAFIKPLPIPERFKKLTQADLLVINQLKFLSFSGFEEVGNRFLNVIADNIYQSAITGKPFRKMVTDIRGSINGVYQRSNESAINRLTDYVAKNRYSSDKAVLERVRIARNQLNSKYASDILGNNMRRYASQIAHDSIMQFDGQFTMHKANEAGITQFKYTGTNITTTRDFCRSNLNRVFTEQEARDKWATGWKGKSGSDPFINRGGYRCRHSFIPYDSAWDNLLEE